MTSSARTRLGDSTVMVHAYLDGELSIPGSVEAERAIAASRELAAEAEAVRALKRALQACLPRESVPPQSAARIAERIGLRAPSRRP